MAGPAWGPFAYFGARCPCRRSPRAAYPAFFLPHFLASPSPPSVPAPRAGSRGWTLSLPLVGDARPTKGPGSPRRPRARSSSGGGEMGPGYSGRVRRGPVGRCHCSGSSSGPPPPTQLTCHPRPRYHGQRDSGRKSHSGSQLIGPARAAAPSFRGANAGLHWTPALSVPPRAAPSLSAPGRPWAPWAARLSGAWVRPRGARVGGDRRRSRLGSAGDLSWPEAWG